MKKQVKYFDSHKASVKIQELEKEAKKLSQLVKLIQQISGSKEIKTLTELNAWLVETVEFESPSFCAEAKGISDGYRMVVRMSKEVSITLDEVTPLYQLKQSTIDKVNERYSLYYTDEELESLDEWKKVVDAFQFTTKINKSTIVRK